MMTALATAAYSRILLVVFAGETPINASWLNQELGQGPLVDATGAHYIAAHSLGRMFEYVSEAFYIAKTERRPVVLVIQTDLQQVENPDLGILRAFDADTGKVLWTFNTGSGLRGGIISYAVDGEQYILVPSGWGSYGAILLPALLPKLEKLPAAATLLAFKLAK